VLEFLRVVKTYGDFVALSDVSFRMDRGDFVYLVGGTGAGKSTAIRLTMMAEFPTRGEVRFDGYSSNSVSRREIPKVRRKLGVVFQDFRLLLDRDVFENVAFALEVTGVPRRDIKRKVLTALSQVGLAHKSKAQPRTLSGGEQQRIALARALVREPILLLADEPTGNLDPKTAFEILTLLRRLNESGTAVLMVTHNLELVARSPGRTLRLNRGVLMEDGV
jgi:cell division transport system ATP-binding protein